MVTVILSDTEAQSFKLWREHQENFELLLNSHVFEMKNGVVEISFDNQGKVGNIDVHMSLFKRGYPHILTIAAIDTASTVVSLERK